MRLYCHVYIVFVQSFILNMLFIINKSINQSKLHHQILFLNGITENQRGDPWVKKIFFSKMFSELAGNILKIQEIFCWLPKHISYSFVMHRTLCTARARFRIMLLACTARAQSSMYHKWIRNMFRESTKYLLNFKNIPIEFWELFWNNFFWIRQKHKDGRGRA